MKKQFTILLCLISFNIFAQPCATINYIITTDCSCFGDANGTVSASASATATPITYTLNPGSIINSTGNFTGLSAGTYTLTASDALSCSVDSVITINEPMPIVFSVVSINNPSCTPGNDGTIYVSATGGTGIFSYSIIPVGAQSTPGNFIGLGAGTYIITATDGNGCTATTNVSLTQPPPISFTQAQAYGSNCQSDSIIVNAQGGTGTIIYSIQPAANQYSSGKFNGLLFATTYTITATDANGCTMTTSVFSSGISSLNSVSAQNTGCGSANGSITLIGSGIDSFKINPGNIINNTGIFTGLSVGTYTIYFLPTACTSYTQYGTIDIKGILNPYPINVFSNYITFTTPSNGTAPFTNFVGNTSFNLPSTPLRCSGIDTITISDANACQFDTILYFNSGNNIPGINLNKNISHATCMNIADGEIHYAPSSPLSFKWLSNSSVIGDTNKNLTGLLPDTFIVEIKSLNNDCIQDISVLNYNNSSCGTIQGISFQDVNNNCIQDSNESVLANTVVTLTPGNLQRITNQLGQYEFAGLSYGTYNVNVHSNTYTNQYVNCDSTITSVISSLQNTDTVSYAFLANPVNPYITSSYTLASAAPNGHPAKSVNLFINKYNNNPITCNIYFKIDSINHYYMAYPNPDLISGDTLIWLNKSIIFPGNYYANRINIYYQNVYYQPNLYLNYKSWIIPNNTNGNVFIDDSTDVMAHVVVSCDPNDKQPFPRGIDNPGYISENDSVINYLIRFQNTGTYYAFNIHIDDTIASQFEIESLEVLSSSHDYQLQRNGNAIRFSYENIMLPDSNTNEEESHGSVFYRLKLKNNLAKGTKIENTAHIYFDYNPAVITNTTLNTIGIPTKVVEVVQSKNYLIFPNPGSGIFYLLNNGNEKISNIALYDLQGRKMEITMDLNKNLYILHCEQIAKGNYILKVNNESLKLSIQ